MAEPARRQREITLQQLTDRVAVGESLLLLCHCRGRGKSVYASNRCHGDGIAAELLRRAATQIAGAAGPTGGITAETGEPMMSERVRAADGGVGERCGAARLDEASDLRGEPPNGARKLPNGGTGATTAAARGRLSTSEAADIAVPMAGVTGGAGEKRKDREMSGEVEVSRGKRPRADKNRKKSPKQRKVEKKQRTEQ